ncbi:glycosyltransferase family 2 protein [Aquabacterium sp.]|uniref:glycosyltransferase family 2 protein n=1 Tax=Aquabacterium sp. TaxID=1872578 RepID=UPI003784E2ED
MSPLRIVAVMTCFNRRETTLRCLGCLAASAAQAGVAPEAVLMDDGSRDGTADAVRAAFPWVRVLQGDGSLFWTRGMHRAQAAALDGAAPDYLLWLNDDTLLLPDALARLLATAQDKQHLHGRAVCVAGATSDAATGALSYSGQVATSRWRRFSFRKVFSEREALRCDTMNGNIVLLPVAAVRAVGNLDPAFDHGGGDIDYGLRLRECGVPLYVAAGIAGHCSNNPSAGGYTDTTAPLRQRWRHILHRKGLPVRTWLPLTRRHGGLLWPLHFAWPYVKVLGSSCLAALKRR